MSDPLELIQARCSFRGPFNRDRSVPEDDLRQILEAARWAPTAHNMQNFEIVVVDDPGLLGQIGDIASPPSEAFIRENYALLSFSEEELRRRRVGLHGASFPASWRTPSHLDIDAALSEPPMHLRDAMQGSPLMLVVTYDPRLRAPASEGDVLGIMSLGCVMENMWLMAASRGLAFHVVSSLEGQAVEPQIKQLLRIPDPARVAFGACVGYPLAAPARYCRVRRELRELVHHNVYGRRR